jgi:hypothetical protein
MDISSDHTHIEEIRSLEERTYAVSQKRLGDTTELVEDVSSLYSTIVGIYGTSGIGPGDKREFLFASYQVLLCQYLLITGCLAIERGHLTDSFQYTRKAIESCAIARKILEHPHLGTVWWEAGRSKEKYEKYRKKFIKLFPKSDPLMSKLYDRYDLCSKRAHGSVVSFLDSLQHSCSKDIVGVYFHYSELKSEDPSEPVRTLLLTLDIHFGIARCFGRILGNVIETDRSTWASRLNAVNGRITSEKKRWRKACETFPG